jgi:TRAP-type mannitol/chloroaromatic compound transport system substrate-binding protein
MQAKQGVKFYKTPDAILQQQLKVYDQVVSEKSKDPLFAEVVASQREFAQRVLRWDMDTNANRRMAFNHYFGKKG